MSELSCSNNSVQRSDFCGLKLYEGQKSIEDFQQHGNNALPQRSVYEWTVVLKNGRTNVIGDEIWIWMETSDTAGQKEIQISSHQQEN
jgi:hypothetical protein